MPAGGSFSGWHGAFWHGVSGFGQVRVCSLPVCALHGECSSGSRVLRKPPTSDPYAEDLPTVSNALLCRERGKYDESRLLTEQRSHVSFSGLSEFESLLNSFKINNFTNSEEIVLTADSSICHHPPMTKAFAYLRVSGKGQIEGDGFERQLLAIRKYAAANDIKIVRIFREEGVSGTTDWDDREAFGEMMTLLMSNGTRTVLVENLSRLARDLMVQESIIADFKRKGLTLVSTSEPDLCDDDPSRIAFRQIMGAFHQYEKSMLVAKLRGARQRAKAKTGRCEGRKPYGTREGEFQVIAKIRELREQGLPLVAIAGVLNSEGIRSRAGVWHPTQVSRILSRVN